MGLSNFRLAASGVLAAGDFKWPPPRLSSSLNLKPGRRLLLRVLIGLRSSGQVALFRFLPLEQPDSSEFCSQMNPWDAAYPQDARFRRPFGHSARKLVDF